MEEAAEEMHDVCALPLVRRLAAMLDRDPASFQPGDPLPRGWHVTLFNEATPQSELRLDGLAGLGVTLPELGLPRVMAAGKRTRFEGDIPSALPCGARAASPPLRRSRDDRAASPLWASSTACSPSRAPSLSWSRSRTT